MRGRYDILRQIEQLDPEQDNEKIVYLVGAYEYPWLMRKSLEFALFRTYGVPSVSHILDHTGEFSKYGQKRYDDTSLILSEISENGYSSERGRRAIQQMNRQHRRYSITNEDYRYVLSTFIFEPIRWHEKFSWRKPTEHEKIASYHFWKEVGKRMNIKDIPESYEAYERFNIEYEREHFVYDIANRHVADNTIQIFLGWFPSPLHGLIRQGIIAMIDDPLREAFGYEKAPGIFKWIAESGLKSVAFIMRFMPPRKQPFLLTKANNRTYPDGYEIEKLGPPEVHS